MNELQNNELLKFHASPYVPYWVLFPLHNAVVHTVEQALTPRRTCTCHLTSLNLCNLICEMETILLAEPTPIVLRHARSQWMEKPRA